MAQCYDEDNSGLITFMLTQISQSKGPISYLILNDQLSIFYTYNSFVQEVMNTYCWIHSTFTLPKNVTMASIGTQV